MMLARLVVVIIFTIIPPADPKSCWEENQSNHQISDFKNNSQVFQYLAFGIEDDIQGIMAQADEKGNQWLWDLLGEHHQPQGPIIHWGQDPRKRSLGPDY